MRDLLLLNLTGITYGIWKDVVLSIKQVDRIQRLPLVPETTAGMVFMDGRSYTLADLAAGLGLPRISRNKSLHILLMSEQDKINGFAVEGDIRQISILPQNTLPMPGYLKNMMTNTCAVYDSLPVPIINISLLFESLKEAGSAFSTGSFSFPDSPEIETGPHKDVRLFKIGTELFAAPAMDIDKIQAKVEKLSNIAQAPDFFGGIICHQKSVLSIIRLSYCLDLPLQTEQEQMIVSSDFNGDRFCFPVDSDYKLSSVYNAETIPLPPIARSNWITHIIKHEDKIVPVLYLPVLVATFQDDMIDNIPRIPADSYNQETSTSSRFISRFGKEDTKIIDFLILGVRYTLPATEVIDTFKIKPFQRIPNISPIVIGVLELNDIILPVLDPALCFGRRSITTPDWNMIHITNGDFSALVITEAVFENHILPVDLQRELPIELPHSVVYGCYPHEEEVRLILNLREIAIHFDKSIVKDFADRLTPEMEKTPSEIVTSLIEAELLIPDKQDTIDSVKEIDTEDTMQKEETSSEYDDIYLNAEISVPSEIEREDDISQSAIQSYSGDAFEPFCEEEEIEETDETHFEFVESIAFHKTEKELTVDVLDDADGLELSVGTEEIEDIYDEDEAYEPVEETTEFDKAVDAELEIYKVAEEAENIFHGDKADISAITTEFDKAVDAERYNNIAEKEEEELQETAGVLESGVFNELEMIEDEHKQGLNIQSNKFLNLETEGSTFSDRIEIKPELKDNSNNILRFLNHEEEPDFKPYAGISLSQDKYKNKIYTYSAISLLIIAALFLYFRNDIISEENAEITRPITKEHPELITHEQPQHGNSDFENRASIHSKIIKPNTEKYERTDKLPADQPMTETLGSRGPGIKSSTPDSAPGSGTNTEDANIHETEIEFETIYPQSQDLPPAASKAASENETVLQHSMTKDTHKVITGDTLWGISEYYTGSGFNYPEIAEENKIKNPHLIFPRQKIIIEQKE